MEFFKTSTGNLLNYEAAAGVGHHVALSIVGTDRLPESGYMRGRQVSAKNLQLQLLQRIAMSLSLGAAGMSNVERDEAGSAC